MRAYTQDDKFIPVDSNVLAEFAGTDPATDAGSAKTVKGASPPGHFLHYAKGCFLLMSGDELYDWGFMDEESQTKLIAAAEQKRADREASYLEEEREREERLQQRIAEERRKDEERAAAEAEWRVRKIKWLTLGRARFKPDDVLPRWAKVVSAVGSASIAFGGGVAVLVAFSIISVVVALIARLFS